MKLSFVIVNYQSEKYLVRCLFSIKKKVLGMDYEVIVINNSRSNIRHSNGIKVINSDKNIGFGAACNLGARSAQGEWLCFLNPDTEIISSDIKKLLDEFHKNNKLAIIGPRLTDDKNRTKKWIAGKEITIISILLNNFSHERDKKIWESPASVDCDWVTGAAMFVSRNIFNQLGGFDEQFFMYFEDIDICKRARRSGYKILYFPSFQVKHLGGKSFSDKKKQKTCYYKSQFKYFKKQVLGL